jgi:HK97 family phage prohead protease
VEVTMSRGSPVDRGAFIERLKISPEAVDLSRMSKGGLSVLDSHDQKGLANILGKVVSVRFDDGALIGKIKFSETPSGQQAMEMVGRGEVAGASIGYVVSKWELRDASGQILDPDEDRIPMDGSVTATATRFEIVELSLVSVPADSDAIFRSLDGHHNHTSARAGMEARARMAARARMVRRVIKAGQSIPASMHRMLFRRQIADHRIIHGD